MYYLVLLFSGEPNETFPNYSEETETDLEQGQAGISKHHMSKAANSHKFQKIQKPSKCRECDKYVYWQGYECADCGLASHKKCLETLHLLCGPMRLLRKMTTFGVELGQHLLEVGADIPPLVQKCVAVVDSRGTAVKGIYRVSGVKSKVEKLCQAFENGAELVDLTDVHPNVIANVVKLYMRQLPEPLMTFRLYSEFIRVGRSCPAPGSGQTAPNEEREAVQQLIQLVSQLPRYHHNTLGFLCQHLNRVAEQAETNNMPASNLAIVFGPTLLKTTEGSASLSSLVDTVHQTRVVELLTRHATTIFGPPESLMSGGGRGQGWEGRRRGRQVITGNKDTERQPGQELRIGSFTDEEQDNENEPIPDFLLPDYSQKVKKSPLMNRASSPPKIIKSSLKNFSGLEGVKTAQLSSQDSVDSSHSHSKSRQASHMSHPATVPESPDGGVEPLGHLAQSAEAKSEGHVERDRTSVTSSIVSINEENKVKIQVPGLPIIKTTKPDKGEVTDH